MNDASKDNGYILYGIREEGGREGGREGGGSRRDDDEALLVGSVSSSRLEVSTRKKNLDTPRVTVTCYVMVDDDLLATIITLSKQWQERALEAQSKCNTCHRTRHSLSCAVTTGQL